MKKLAIVGAAWALAGVAATHAVAETAAEFYKGKTVTVLIGFPPGGGYDANGRALARHIGKFIPGNPTVVASNMPGAGSLTAANHTFNTAPQDGSTFTIFASSAALDPLLGNKAARFDAAKFGWIGSMAQEVAYCGIWQSPGAASSWKDVMERETIFGGGAAAAITYQHPMILKNVLGAAKMKVVSGYPGTRDVNLAMNRGEVNGSCGLFGSSIMSQWRKEVESGQIKLVIQMGFQKSKQFGDIPSVFDFAKTDQDRQILEIHFHQQLLSRPFAFPPNVPAERLSAMREAFMATMRDKEFLADAQKIGLDIDPVSGQEIEAALKRFASFPPQVLQKAAEAMGR
ncbi:MAG: Bug family tripartite tricarboxylate transporter substrate binding protein [Beijerinckiaceae bacterium]